MDDGGRVELVERFIGKVTADVEGLVQVDGGASTGVQLQVEVSEAAAGRRRRRRRRHRLTDGDVAVLRLRLLPEIAFNLNSIQLQCN